jgi:hypothetical protein
MTDCAAMLFMYEGEYEGECELPAGHDGPHWDGTSTWRSDADGFADYDTVDIDEDFEAIHGRSRRSYYYHRDSSLDEDKP